MNFGKTKMLKKALSERIEPVASVEKTAVPDYTALTSAHRNAVKALADHLGITVHDVYRLYCIVLNRLAKEAKIKDYLPILVSRRVSYLIQKRIKMSLQAGRMINVS
jgi:Protein of unknown function (DUF3562)